MKPSKEQRRKFLDVMRRPALSKELIFDTLFETCGIGECVNTKHVFFQDVIIKFNASKAMAVIEKGVPYETESHYVDVALYAYIRSGYDMKSFTNDLAEYKKKNEVMYVGHGEKCSAFINA